jgi:surface polysaccharide O-acyltransferase-like enzyme
VKRRSLIESKMNLNYDIIRLFATILVITIHVAGPGFENFHENWTIVNFYDSFSRVAVPLFLMLSGALMLEKEYSLKLFFNKRFNKVLIPFIFWSIIFTLRKGILDIGSIFLKPAYFHLGFLYILLNIYLCFPIASATWKALSNEKKKYLLILWFTGSSVLPFTRNFQNISFGIDLVMFTPFLGYVFLGAYLKDFKSKFSKNIGILVYAVSSLLVAFGTNLLSIKNGSPTETIYSYLSPLVITGAGGLFVAINSIDFSKNKFFIFVARLSELTFGIYFIHIVVLELLASKKIGIELSWGSFSPIFSIPIIVLLCLIISSFIVFIIKKIPVINRIV